MPDVAARAVGKANVRIFRLKSSAAGSKVASGRASGAGGDVDKARRTEKWRKRVAILGDDRIRYLSGKRLRQYSRDELGKFKIITDVFGGFSYTEDLSLFMEKVLGFLEVGGAFYTLIQNVRLEDGKDQTR